MLRFVLRRLVAGLVLVTVIATVGFFLLYLSSGSPTDVARNLVGATAPDDVVQQKVKELHLDQSVTRRYGDWAGDAVQGKLGVSWSTGEPVTDAIFTTRLQTTLTLVIGATLLTAVIAVALGVLAATRGGWADKVVQVLAVLGFAIPGFLIALFLVTAFAVQLGWFEPTGYTRFTDSPAQWLSSITLPVIALAIPGIAGVAAQVRGSMLDELRKDYVRTLRSRGLSARRVRYRHVLRNAGGPALTVLALQFVALLGSTVLVEQIFAIPGVGKLAVEGTAKGDLPIVMGIIVVTAVVVVTLNLLVDLAQGWLNPKVRLGG